MNLSIIIVSYNTKELLSRCLQSLFRWCEDEFKNGAYEVIVVDNGSSDGSLTEIQNSKLKIQNFLKIIKNETNLGFAKANNIGIKAAQGKTILLLNSDTEIKDLAIQKTLGYLENQGNGGNRGNLGVVSCRINLTNGILDPSCHRGFPTPWNAFCYFLEIGKIISEIKTIFRLSPIL